MCGTHTGFCMRTPIYEYVACHCCGFPIYRLRQLSSFFISYFCTKNTNYSNDKWQTGTTQLQADKEYKKKQQRI